MSYLPEQKVGTNAQLDLGLYLENLFIPVEEEQKPEADNTVEVQSAELIETEHLHALVETEVETHEVAEGVTTSELIPKWAQQEFDCLLIKLAGMHLLLPAMAVDYIEHIDKKIRRIPLDTDAFKGVISSRGNSIPVIDLFSLLSENTSSEAEAIVDAHQIDYVTVMQNGEYALACDKVIKLVRMEQDDVRWNKASFDNPLFMGIVTGHLCPLLNIDEIDQQVAAMPFVQSFNKRSKPNKRTKLV